MGEGGEKRVQEAGCGAGRRQAERLPQGPGWEGPPALGTWRAWPAGAARRPAVDALVAQHVLAAPETLAALPAGERPRARVRLAVAHKVLAPVEGLAALAAGVWLLAPRLAVVEGRARRSENRAGIRPVGSLRWVSEVKGLYHPSWHLSASW